MNIHKNARLTPLGRERLVKLMLSGQPIEAPHLDDVASLKNSRLHAWFRAEPASPVIGLQCGKSHSYWLQVLE